MPSAASVKIDKQINQENALAESSQNLTPLRQAITVIEHKIRNLEKRKSKLESYKELQNAGKELNADQKTAVAKFNEVINTLDFARDLCKQFLGIAAVSEKEAKKLAKKEAALKYQAELARLREILLVQDALNQMGNENVREDFLHGKNGAAQLTESDLKLLDDFYPAVTPKHEAGNPTTFTNEVQAAAEHLLAAVDGKSKEVFGGTYSQIKETLGKIHESGYFDQAQVFESYEDTEAPTESEVALPAEPVPAVADLPAPSLVPQTELVQPPPQPQVPLTAMAPLENLAMDVRPPPAVPPAETVELAPAAAVVPLVPPPEQAYYQQVAALPLQQPQPPHQQPPRPIAEMLGTGSFFFLQDSEIDPPPEQIPSQTFTNQNFNAHPPQHPVPMPPHFAPMPNNHQVPQMSVGNNGIDENAIPPEEQIQVKEAVATGVNRGPPRPANNQSYYQNNNYNNRPRPSQNRNGNGPRPINARHN